MRRNAIAIASILLLVAFFISDSFAETATPGEMDNVCLNWLSVVVYENGGWAGVSNPEIVDVRDIVGDNGRVLARCYSIAPRG